MITELSDDWAVVPFVSIRVSDTECEADEEAAFVREWGGTVGGCTYPDNVYRGSELYEETVLATREEYNNFIFANKRDATKQAYERAHPCTIIFRTPPIQQEVFFGKRFCGKRGGLPFKDAVRPEDQGNGSFACDSRYPACSAATSPENTICNAEAATKSAAEACPITFMAIVAAADAS